MINIIYFTYPNTMYPGVYHLNKINTFIKIFKYCKQIYKIFFYQKYKIFNNYKLPD